MRVLLDTHLLISYLLKSDPLSPIHQIVVRAILGQLALHLPESLLEELRTKVHTTAYLLDRISLEDVALLVSELTRSSETIPKITEQIPAITRNPKDDYLLAYALVGRADYLISSDPDLLSLEPIEGLHILTPTEFVQGLPAF